jgi:hypothetical protein
MIRSIIHTAYNLITRIGIAVPSVIYCAFGLILIYVSICFGLLRWVETLPDPTSSETAAQAAVPPPASGQPSTMTIQYINDYTASAR